MSRWGIAHPIQIGAVFGVMAFVGFLGMSAAHGQLSLKTVIIGLVMGIVAWVLATLVAASYGGNVSLGSGD